MQTTFDQQMENYRVEYEDPSLAIERQRNSVAAIVELLKQLTNPELKELHLNEKQLGILRKLLAGNPN